MHLRGCFCDWPGRGPHVTPWQPRPGVFVNDIDQLFNDPDAQYYTDGYGLHPTDLDAPQAPDYDPPGGEIGYTIAILTIATSSLSLDARPLATTPPVFLPNLTWIESQSIRQRLYTMLPEGEVFSIIDGRKGV